MDILEQIRSLREGLDRIEAELLERPALPEEASPDERASWLALMEIAERARWQSLDDQKALVALRSEVNALRYELVAAVHRLPPRPAPGGSYLAQRALQLQHGLGHANVYTLKALLCVNFECALTAMMQARSVTQDPWAMMAMAEATHMEGQS